MNSRVDGRGVSGSLEHAHDRIETTPQGAGNTRRGLTHPLDSNNWRAAMQSTDNERRRLAGDYLTRIRDDYERAARTRVYYVLLAHQYGMSNVDIGALLGITEAAVRGLIKRHGGDR